MLALRALRRYGDMSPSTTDGETALMFMDYANSVLDDIMEHPYWDKGVTLSYYSHPTEKSAVPDTVMLAGLIYRYALDQGSTKTKVYEAEYFRRMNQVMARRKFGVGAEFVMQVVDREDSSAETKGVV